MTMTRSRPPRRRVRVASDCVCTPDGQLCLAYYDALDPGRQAAARRRAGVHEPYLGPWR